MLLSPNGLVDALEILKKYNKNSSDCQTKGRGGLTQEETILPHQRLPYRTSNQTYVELQLSKAFALYNKRTTS